MTNRSEDHTAAERAGVAVFEQRLNQRRRNARFLQIVARLEIKKGPQNGQKSLPAFHSRCLG
jgi:hypothetical protein